MSRFSKFLGQTDKPSDSQTDILRNTPDIPLDGSTIRVPPEQRSIAGRAHRPEDWIHFLVTIEGESRGRRIEIGTSPLTLGRTAPADIVLQDAKISRIHASIRLEDGKVWVRDLGSTNGTYVDGRPVDPGSAVTPGSLLTIGNHTLKLEQQLRSEFLQARNLDADLERAGHYVRALLPAPMADGPIMTSWILQPSSKLGGDALGYHALSDGKFAFYLMDVSGHGVGAAMHAVTVLNVVRKQSLPDTDFADPAAVLGALNTAFSMDAHDRMYLTMWYGVFDPTNRCLTYASAGHHPAYLRTASQETQHVTPLQTRNLMLGALPGIAYQSASVTIPAGARVYLFSDGVFEITTRDGAQWQLRSFVDLISGPENAGASEPERLHTAVLEMAGTSELDDDFTLLTVTFL